MREPRYPRLLAKALARRGRPEPRAVDPARCADEIELVKDTVHRLAGRKRARAVAGAGTALLLAGLTWTYLNGPEAHPRESSDGAAPPGVEVVASSSGRGTTIVSGESSAPLEAQTRLATGSRLLVGPVAGASLALSTGSRIAIEPESDVTVVGQGRASIFNLGSGSLRADVAKLAPADRFLVRTADSEIEVRGTSFRVSVVLPDPDCGDGTTTHVKVYEGTVTVRRNGREESVVTGEEWPRGCAQALVPRPARALAAPSDGRAETGRASSRSAPRADVSNLAAQNDQFADAMNVKRRGDVPATIAAFDRFLAMHPSSYLAENAAAERMKLLAIVDRSGARAAARQYLQKYPSGFACDDARALIAGTRAP